MLRDPNLIPLSHQHHNALLMCVLTRRSLRQDDSPANVAKLARNAIDRYELELANHFEIEEQILFPAIEHALGKLPLVSRLVAQHREAEDLIAQLRSAPDAALLERLCGLLGEHIRCEERDLFQMAQSQMPEPTLRELGGAIQAKVVRICL
ncbi:MAG TPA: hemerythrin domain-containing protein [Bryobacteraceae bacterium]|nr:hemerythrin domain-containing protein [Bryobacteraceae bacterium]